jgi:hypothetical protein
MTHFLFAELLEHNLAPTTAVSPKTQYHPPKVCRINSTPGDTAGSPNNSIVP